ncbi:MAG TPA: LpxD N-terminal domain-containing protein, partial [Pyrinomonadaceae bacterium]|nr:LpxD N-terminal domain-containing protein [Pyrinomonadaceae bacterium]
MKLSELAKLTDSTLENGDGELEITSAAGLDIASPSDVSFLANPKYTPQINDTKAGAIFLTNGVKIERTDIAVLRVADSYVAYTLALRAFFPEPELRAFIHPTAVIDDTATVHPNVEIHANVVIGRNCTIASGVKIMPNVTIYDGVSIGEGTTLHSGVSVRENCE